MSELRHNIAPNSVYKKARSEDTRSEGQETDTSPEDYAFAEALVSRWAYDTSGRPLAARCHGD